MTEPNAQQIVVVDEPDPDDIAELVRSLVAFNDAAASAEEYRKLAVFAREGETLIGGASGHTHWQWLFVSHLWVAETHRNAGPAVDYFTRSSARQSVADVALLRSTRSASRRRGSIEGMAMRNLALLTTTHPATHVTSSGNR